MKNNFLGIFIRLTKVSASTRFQQSADPAPVENLEVEVATVFSSEPFNKQCLSPVKHINTKLVKHNLQNTCIFYKMYVNNFDVSDTEKSGTI